MDAATLVTIITMFVVTDTSSEFVKYDGLGAVSYTHLTLPTICSV